jgi:hypothetical protein
VLFLMLPFAHSCRSLALDVCVCMGEVSCWHNIIRGAMCALLQGRAVQGHRACLTSLYLPGRWAGGANFVSTFWDRPCGMLCDLLATSHTSHLAYTRTKPTLLAPHCMLPALLLSCTVQETDAGREAGPNTVGSEFRGVLRSEVLRVLAAALPPGIIQPSAQVVEVVSPGGDSQGKGGAAQQQWPVLRLSSGEMIQGSVVVGADGARSSVAGEKGLGLPPPNYAGYVAHR